MSQVITNAFEKYWQSCLAAEKPVVLDEFILADIPNLDITSPIDPETGLPPENQIVHRQNVDQRGRINNNAVAYTIVMDTTVGDFSFNAMYLRNKANGVIGMIVYKGRETKLKTDQTTGQTGNSLVKSMLMGYDQAAEATLTNVDAGTWQIDYAARLRGMDEDIRQLQADLYGHHTFVGDGFKVVEKDGAYQVSQGVAIVGGLRVELKAPEVINPGTKPIGVWVDVHRAGSLLSEHQNHFTIITSVADLSDHVDSNGYQHYVAKLGTILADTTIEDGRSNADSGSTGVITDIQKEQNSLGKIDGYSKIGSGSYADIRGYDGDEKRIKCFGMSSVFDGRHGEFAVDDEDAESPDDGVVTLIDAKGRRWKRVHVGALLPRFAGVIGDGICDDFEACVNLVNAFKLVGNPAPGGLDMQGNGIDWTGYRCAISRKLDLSGIFNYSFTNPAFIAHVDFVDNALLRIDSDRTYLASGITWINPQLDAAWLADYCVEAFDFVKWTMISGKFSHYRKKGFITGQIKDAPHEVNVVGTFFFQREWNEVYPPSIVEGEAWELNNYDNDFSNVVVGYQMKWAFTNVKGANRFVGGHVYTGHKSISEGGARSLDSDDDFVGTYFDNTWLSIAKTRTSVQACQFAVSEAGLAIRLGDNPYRVKIVNNRFRKKVGSSSNCIEMPKVKDGRVSRPDIYDNQYEGCTGVVTRGALYQPVWSAEHTVEIPDDFLPISNIASVGKSSNVVGYSDRIHSFEYDQPSNILKVKTYKIESDGRVLPALMDGKSLVIQLNI